MPEMVLAVGHGSDLRQAARPLYYTAIGSFLLLLPGLALPYRAARMWMPAVTAAMGIGTLIVGFYALVFNARWALSAHEALMQTNAAEACAFLATCLDFSVAAACLAWSSAFAGCAWLLWRLPRPSLRTRTVLLASFAIACTPGLIHIARYGGRLVHELPGTAHEPLRLVDMDVTKSHPVAQLALNHHNYLSTHTYRMAHYAKSERHRERLRGARPLPEARPPRIAVVVIGESSNRRHWSLYGYARDTTPRLCALGREIVRYDDVISSSVSTLEAIRNVFSLGPDQSPLFCLPDQAGFRTHWLSSQYSQGIHDLETAAFVQTCSERHFLEGANDAVLVPLLGKAIASPGRHLVFCNLFGSHTRYSDRYPAHFDRFKGETERERLVASYDNSILYTDHVLAELIGQLRSADDSAVLVYLSDHGEDVFDTNREKYLFRNEAEPTAPMYEIPFFVWFSPRYRQENPEVVSAAENGRQRAWQAREFGHSLLHLLRLSHPLYDETRDLFSSRFEQRERTIGVDRLPYRKGRDPTPAE